MTAVFPLRFIGSPVMPARLVNGRRDDRMECHHSDVPIDQAALTALTALLPPPDAPVTGDRSWDWSLAKLGTRLPTEYIALMDTYGCGQSRSGRNRAVSCSSPGPSTRTGSPGTPRATR